MGKRKPSAAVQAEPATKQSATEQPATAQPATEQAPTEQQPSEQLMTEQATSGLESSAETSTTDLASAISPEPTTDDAAATDLEAAHAISESLERADAVSADVAEGEVSAPDAEGLETSAVSPESSPDEATAPAESADAADDDVALPTDASRIESILESLLFATDRPLGIPDLKRLLGERDGKRITEALESLREKRADGGVQLISAAGGWQLRTNPRNGAWVGKLVAGRPQRLSRAMMETLAIVAYRQPITRPEIDEIRGVDCGPVLRTLLDRALVRIIGKKEEVGRPMLYGTTPEFLKTFSLRDLTELPTLRDFHELGAAERAEVDAKLPQPEAAAAASSPPDADPPRPATVELSHVDAGEEEALLEELEEATQAAGRATASALDANKPENPPADAAGTPPGDQ